MFDNSIPFLSLEKTRSNLFRLQRRILKSVFVGDFVYALKLQRLLLSSNSARFLSIRFVTKTINNSKSFDFCKNVFLTLEEKFKINSLLLKTAHFWKPMNYKDIILSDGDLQRGSHFKLWSIPDRCWQCLVKFALEPAHLMNVYPRNFPAEMLYNIHKSIQLNLVKESYGLQKRVLLVSFSDQINSFNFVYLLKKLFLPRSIKMSIYRFLKLKLDLSYKLEHFNPLGFFLINFLFNDLYFSFNCITVNNKILIFLKPSDNEFLVVDRFFKCLRFPGVDEVSNYNGRL